MGSDDDAQPADLAEMRQRYPLPTGWSIGESFIGSICAAGVSLDRAGLLASGPGQLRAMGAAAKPTDDGGLPALARAYFEPLERISLVEARAEARGGTRRRPDGASDGEVAHLELFPLDPEPETLRHSLSNGVALKPDWERACEAASAELWERDLVLRAFYGELWPRPIETGDALQPGKLAAHYELGSHEFVDDSGDAPLRCVALVAFPHSNANPLLLACGTGEDIEAAIAGARREFWQRLAFLWGEELPSTAPTAAPTPEFHQEFYLLPAHHDGVRSWLAGGHVGCGPTLPGADRPATVFADITPASMCAGLRVARALNPSALPLLFGTRTRFEQQRLPAAMQHHPIA